MLQSRRLASAVALSLLLPALSATAAPDPLVGRTVESFTLKDHRGKEFDLAGAEAKLVVVAFLGTECPLAKLYAPELQRIADDYAERGVAVVGINANSQDSITEIAAYVKEHALAYPVLKDVGNEVADGFRAKRTPEVFVLDGERTVRYHGRVDDRYGVGWARENAQRHDLRVALDELLAGKPVSMASTAPVGCIIGRVREPKADAPVTYGNQISRIVARRCVECHREGEIAPFTLTSYEDVAGWAETMLEVVEQNRMPPWHANPKHGSFANDRSMPTEERELLRRWVEDGAPAGDLSNLPAPPAKVAGWRLPVEPDLVVPMRERPYEVPAEGEVKYQYFRVDPGFTEDKYVRMAEVVPGDRRVVHHVLVLVRPPGGGRIDEVSNWVAAYVPGSGYGVYPKGMAKRIPAGSQLVFQVHYTPVGSPRRDLSKVGFVFADPDEIDHVVVTQAAIQPRLRIPAGEDDHRVEARFPRSGRSAGPVRVLAFMPHMHLRGKAFRYDLHLPGGETRTLLDVPEYDFNWQTRYVLDEPLEVPAGSYLRCTAAFDNSTGNVWNPDPTREVRWGDQTWEEMMIGYFDIAVPHRPGAGGELAENALHRRLFTRLDSNGDGVLTGDEVPVRQRKLFDRIDADSDEKLSFEEFSRGLDALRR